MHSPGVDQDSLGGELGAGIGCQSFNSAKGKGMRGARGL